MQEGEPAEYCAAGYDGIIFVFLLGRHPRRGPDALQLCRRSGSVWEQERINYLAGLVSGDVWVADPCRAPSRLSLECSGPHNGSEQEFYLRRNKEAVGNGETGHCCSFLIFFDRSINKQSHRVMGIAHHIVVGFRPHRDILYANCSGPQQRKGEGRRMNVSNRKKSAYREHLQRELRENPQYARGKRMITIIAIAALLLKLSVYTGEFFALGTISFDFSHFITLALFLAVTVVVIEGFTLIGTIFYLYSGLTELSQILLVSYYLAGEGKTMAIGKFIQDYGAVSVLLIVIALGSIAAGICLAVLPQVKNFRRRTKEIRSQYPRSTGLHYK